MKYKIEILKNGVVKKDLVMNLTHPNQTIKKIKNYLPLESCAVAIMNENGEKWLYIIKINNNGRIVKRYSSNDKYSQYDIDLVFARAKPIFNKV